MNFPAPSPFFPVQVGKPQTLLSAGLPDPSSSQGGIRVRPVCRPGTPPRALRARGPARPLGQPPLPRTTSPGSRGRPPPPPPRRTQPLGPRSGRGVGVGASGASAWPLGGPRPPPSAEPGSAGGGPSGEIGTGAPNEGEQMSLCCWEARVACCSDDGRRGADLPGPPSVSVQMARPPPCPLLRAGTAAAGGSAAGGSRLRRGGGGWRGRQAGGQGRPRAQRSPGGGPSEDNAAPGRGGLRRAPAASSQRGLQTCPLDSKSS